MYCIDPSKRGDITEAGRIWHNDEILRTVSTAAVAHDLVFISDFAGFIHCLDAATGKSFWKYDALAAIWGSPMVADGKVYIGDEDGDIAVLAAGKELKVLSETSMGSSVYSTPVAANGVLYIMTRDTLYALSGGR
jgi:outer membrane protein assembly factor BamB